MIDYNISLLLSENYRLWESIIYYEKFFVTIIAAFVLLVRYNSNAFDEDAHAADPKNNCQNDNPHRNRY
jgi:hypothetical protein